MVFIYVPHPCSGRTDTKILELNIMTIVFLVFFFSFKEGRKVGWKRKGRKKRKQNGGRKNEEKK